MDMFKLRTSNDRTSIDPDSRLDLHVHRCDSDPNKDRQHQSDDLLLALKLQQRSQRLLPHTIAENLNRAIARWLAVDRSIREDTLLWNGIGNVRMTQSGEPVKRLLVHLDPRPPHAVLRVRQHDVFPVVAVVLKLLGRLAGRILCVFLVALLHLVRDADERVPMRLERVQRDCVSARLASERKHE